MPKKKKKKNNKIFKHISGLGFTNRLAIYVLIFLACGLFGGFFLAYKSIQVSYSGALACWTIVFTPIGTATSIVLSKVVDKNRDENTGGNGDGIKFAAAKASGFTEEHNWESPEI